ncbi:MAG: PTS sugar transporter subunit IIC [Lachnospiraceae bacterium]|jgi:PTS system cellobiose-specific IIC component|nr:PTS sugar transporter subunit IIC [Lachnospiraceae bacterium]
MKEKLQTILQKVSAFTSTRYMKILMNGFMGMSAITICGSLFTLLKSLPFDPWLNFLASSGIGDLLSIPVSITTDAVALYIVLSMAYETGKTFKENAFASALVALGSFLLLTPFNTIVYSADYTVATPVSNVIPVSAIGSSGMFLAILVGISASRLYIFFVKKGWKIRMPDSVPPNVTAMFESLIPGGLVFVVFLVIRYVMGLTSFGTAQSLIYGMLQQPLTAVGGGLGGLIVFELVSSFLWLFGIHGGMVAYVGMAPIITVMSTENLAAFAAGLPAPHPEWAMMAFIIMGGGGATLGMNMLMVSKLCKSEQYKTLGKIALPTSLFNINEPLIFGTPLIMNPTLAIPFVVTPLANLMVCMLGYQIGFFVPTGASINGFMPFGVLGALLTGSWTGAVMSVLLLVMDIMIYLPFFKVSDAMVYKREQEAKSAEA